MLDHEVVPDSSRLSNALNKDAHLASILVVPGLQSPDLIMDRNPDFFRALKRGYSSKARAPQFDAEHGTECIARIKNDLD